MRNLFVSLNTKTTRGLADMSKHQFTSREIVYVTNLKIFKRKIQCLLKHYITLSCDDLKSIIC